jgi:hypothetical protein
MNSVLIAALLISSAVLSAEAADNMKAFPAAEEGKVASA